MTDSNVNESADVEVDRPYAGVYRRSSVVFMLFHLAWDIAPSVLNVKLVAIATTLM